jgi:prepilin-type N-terminal cleavage/methylation domain-containing protein
MKKAFTLIELLVVIAIIAILAAILFPVFAQAKAAAKRTQAISNAKQNTLGAIMYTNDQDDVMMPITTWRTSGAPAFVGGVPMSPWTWNILPYMKNTDILMDPQAPPMTPWPATWPANTAKALSPQFGYNYSNLAPMISVAATLGFPGNIQPQVKSSTSVANPADTVFLVAKNSTAEVKGLSSATGFWWFGAGTFNIQMGVESPFCDPAPTVVCGYAWGFTGFGTSILGATATTNAAAEQAGAYTGTSSLRGTGQMTISWVDGHVNTRPWGAMVKGTNFARTGANWPNGDNGWAYSTTNRADYLWDIE